MQGKIIKGIAGFYYVYAEETDTIYECKAKGIFRNRRVKPLVGDLVAIEVLDEEQAKGNITLYAALKEIVNALTRRKHICWKHSGSSIQSGS